MTSESKERVEQLFSDQRSGLLTAKEYRERLRQLTAPELFYLSDLTSQYIEEKGLTSQSVSPSLSPAPGSSPIVWK